MSAPRITPLERQERRPTGVLLFLGALFLLPVGTCGGIGATKAVASGASVADVTVETLAAPARRVEDGAYVRFRAPLRPAARGTSTTVYEVEGWGTLFVAAALLPLRA